MAGLGREAELETENEQNVAAQEGATFELGHDADRLDSEECQGQRCAGPQNGPPLVCGRSIEEANCTSLPSRSDAPFFAPRQLATMRPAPSLTDGASANFPSVLEPALNAENERGIGRSLNATSEEFVELSMGDSSHPHQTDGTFEVPDNEPSPVIIRDRSVEDANKRSFSRESASELEDELVNLNQSIGSPNAQVTTHDVIARKLSECDLSNEGTILKVDSHLNMKPGRLDSEMKSAPNTAKTVTKAQMRNTVGRLEHHPDTLEGIPVAGPHSLDYRGAAIAENCEVAHSSRMRATSAGSLLPRYSIEEALSRAYDEAFPTRQARNTGIVKIFDLRGTHSIMSRTRRNLEGELLVIGSVPAGAWWNKDGVFNLDSARDHFALETMPESVERPQCIDVSRELASGMVVSISNAGVATEPTNAETKQASVCPDGLHNDDIDRQADLVPASYPTCKTECREVPALFPLALPLAFPQLASRRALGLAGSIQACNLAAALPASIHLNTPANYYRCSLQTLPHPESFPPNVLKNEAIVTTDCTVDEKMNSFEHDTDLAVPAIGACVELDYETEERDESTGHGESFVMDNALVPSGDASSKRSSVELATGPTKSARLDLVGAEPATQQLEMNDSFIGPLSPRYDTTSSPSVSLSQVNGANELASAGQNLNHHDPNFESCSFSSYRQIKGEVSPPSAAMSDSSGSVFKTGNSDESYHVPCAQTSLNEVEEHDRSFYEGERAMPDVVKIRLPEQAGCFDLEAERVCYLDDLPHITSAEMEELRDHVRVLVASQAPRPSTPTTPLGRQAGSLSSSDVDEEESSAEDVIEEDGSNDSSRTLHTTTDESDLSEYDQVSCYSVFSDVSASSSGASGGASNTFDRFTQYTRHDEELPEDAESSDELFMPVGCSASSYSRKRKADWSPEGSPEAQEDPFAGLIKKARLVQLESAVGTTPHVELKPKDDSGVAVSATAQPEEPSSSVTTATGNGSLHRLVLSQHNYCKNSTEEDLNERYSRRLGVDGDAMDVSPLSSAMTGRRIKPRGDEESTNQLSTPRVGVAKLVDYPECTPPREENDGDSTPPVQHSQRRPLADISNNKEKPQRNTGNKADVYKKVMEIYFNENSRNFMVVPAYQECPDPENSENIPPDEIESGTEHALYASGGQGVEPSSMQAPNEPDVPRKSAAFNVASTSEEKSNDHGEADCEGPKKKIRRIGLPKSFKGQALHPNWKANVEN